MIVGLTGGIGSGKSTVANFFKELGIPVYDSDREAKLLMEDAPEIRKAVTKLFGAASYDQERLNKKHISGIVFQNAKKLKKLNAIVHPAVRQHFLKWTSEQDTPYVVQETALIFENDSQENYDAIILVTSPEEVRIQRVSDRDGVGADSVRQRIDNQLSDQKKIPLSDFIIENTSLKDTQLAVRKIHKQLLKQSTINESF